MIEMKRCKKCGKPLVRQTKQYLGQERSEWCSACGSRLRVLERSKGNSK